MATRLVVLFALLPLAACKGSVVPAPIGAVHAIGRTDLALMRDARPSIAGASIRWCASQVACSVQTVEARR